jgi:Muramidase (flagellum-specific)
MQGLWQYAQAASAKTGIDPRLIMAQTALETGYGKSIPGNNYFGIKGGGGAPIETTEVINGRPTRVLAPFRGYKSPEESFQDYASFMQGNRYAGVRQAKGLEAQIAELGKSGYATDPDYAKKLLAIAQGIPEAGFGTGSGAEGAGAGAGGGGATPSPAQPPTDKATTPWAKSLGSIASGLGDTFKMQQPLGQGGRIPQLPQLDSPPPSAVPLIAPSAADENRRNQLAALMQQYWI